MIDWNTTIAAVWRQRKEILRPVVKIDPIAMNELLGIDSQKQQLIANTKRFIRHEPCNNVLLWGARGTGKSSLIKAVLNAFHSQSLRLIEVDKLDLMYLPDIVDDIRDLPQRFIIFCDDLSFEATDSRYKSLKSVLEGSIELPPENVKVYATSNRRHLLPEYMKDNLETQIVNGEVHYSDTIEETISLADRFGLKLGFYPQNTETYLAIVDSLFHGFQGNRAILHTTALDYAHVTGSKSGRTAKQFYNAVVIKNEVFR